MSRFSLNTIRIGAFLGAVAAATLLQAGEYSGTVTGYGGSMSDVSVILESRTVLRTLQPDEYGEFTFKELDDGSYFVKVQVPGHRTTPARKVEVPPQDDEPTPFVLERLTSDDFVFHWEEDQSTAGLEYSSQINTPVKIEFLGEATEVADTPDSGSLLSEFNVVLVNDEERWTSEHSYRLHEMFVANFEDSRFDFSATDKHSRWTLASEELADDIEIVKHDDGSQDIRIAAAAFANASPKIVQIDGQRGIWYSQRLHRAVVRFVTDNGRDTYQVSRILSEQYGVRQNADYVKLTANTTGETRSSFQAFQPEELIALINLMEEMPRGFHKIPQLRHIVRRINGVPHPTHPSAPAVAWTGAGYIEFMESAFTQPSGNIHRLILHEKAHFLWAHIFDEQTRDDWIELGEWYPDPDATSGWSTHQTTQFVSAYAHLLNPDEDMAESIADFVVNPDILKSRAPDKYSFIRDRIMAGNYYISKIRDDLTFEVYNLYPDYVYPGKIRRVDIRVEGGPDEDKVLHVEVELHALDSDREGASHAHLRIRSDVGTFFDMYLLAVNEHGVHVSEGTVLRGTANLSKYAKAGYWYPHQAKVYDLAGNTRYQRSNSFEMKIYMDNPHEDYFAPEYDSNSIKVAARSEIRTVFGVERELQVINVSWGVNEDTGLPKHSGCYVSLVVDQADTGSYGEWGDLQNERCSVDSYMPHYMRSGTYSVRYVLMEDIAMNRGSYVFLDDGPERIPAVEIITGNPDTQPPEIDVNRIYVDAEPTNPDNPNGETHVTITYYIRDDNSGIFDTGVTIRDPQGGSRFRWHQVPGRSYAYSPPELEGVWQKLTMNWLLPEGSPPGTWGIQSMLAQDKAENQKRYSFTETIHVDVQNRSNVILIH